MEVQIPFSQKSQTFRQYFLSKMAETNKQEGANWHYKVYIAYLESQIKLAKEVGDRAGEGRAYGNLGNAHHRLGNFQKAKDYYQRCLEIAKEVGNRAAEGCFYGNLGNAHLCLGDFQKAKDYYQRCLEIAKEVGNRAAEGGAYGKLGIAHVSLGDFLKAIDYHERDLEIAKDVGDRAEEGRAYCNLGNAHFSLGDFQKAIDYHERDLEIAKEVGDRAGEGRAYCNLGNAHHRLGDFQKAIDYHEHDLEIAKEVGDRAGKGRAYGNLGNAHFSLGDFQKAIVYHERRLEIAKEVRDRAGEGRAYGNLGNAHCRLGDFQKAVDYHERYLEIAKEVGDRAAVGGAYANLGNTHCSLGAFQKAIDYYERHLEIAKEVRDRAGEGRAYGNLGNAHHSLGDFQKAIDYHERDLEIAKKVGDRAGEGRAYCNLGIAHCSLGDFQKALDYHKRVLTIAKEVGDRAGEGCAYGNLGNAHLCLGDFQKAIDYHERVLDIAKEVGDRATEGVAYANLGRTHLRLGDLQKVIACFQRSIATLNHVRNKLHFNDEGKVSFRDMHKAVYANLWRLLLKQGKIVEALSYAEKGRAQALKDLMEQSYGLQLFGAESGGANVTNYDILSCLKSNIIFIGIDIKDIVFWVSKEGEKVELRRGHISDDSKRNNVETYIQCLMQNAYFQLNIRGDIKCEDRSLEDLKNEKRAEERSSRPEFSFSQFKTSALRTLYDVVFGPIADLLQGNEVIFVPEGPLCLAPYAAFMDPHAKYLCETFRIRVLPSLTSLKLITGCPDDYHRKTGALLVGDPWVQGVSRLQQLPYARKEVEMIARILRTAPLIGSQATKDEVLKRLSSVALVHIAAHGNMETGEIALAPTPPKSSSTANSAPPFHVQVEENFLLTIKDVLKVQMRARLVVLSCCHSARGEIKAEGVVGIARAFLGAGARSVLVSLWAIDDEATLELMKNFYRHLVKGNSASEALNQAMKCMRESEMFSAVKYWAPFVLIGDDVTLEFNEDKQLAR